MKTISVIITTYNSSDSIESTLDSIFSQNGIDKLFNLEVIIVDDASTDNTVDLIRGYKAKTIVNQQNSGGPNKGRNLGLKASTGDFICITDHDDVWHPDKLETMLPYLEQAPIVSSGYILNDRSRDSKIERIATYNEEVSYYKKNETFLKKLTKSLKGQKAYIGSLLFSKSLQNVFFEEAFGVVDYDWILRLFHQQTSIEINKALYTRNVFGSNLSLNEEYRRKDFYYSLLTIERFQDEYPAEVKLSYKKIHGSRARFYYVTGNMKKARFYFRKAPFSLKIILYYFTTFFGSNVVKKISPVFG